MQAVYGSTGQDYEINKFGARHTLWQHRTYLANLKAPNFLGVIVVHAKADYCWAFPPVPKAYILNVSSLQLSQGGAYFIFYHLYFVKEEECVNVYVFLSVQLSGGNYFIFKRFV